jgi:hypothetical protein
MSDALSSSRGLTSMTVSVRSLAMILASPTLSSIVTEIGSGVAKIGMAVLPFR